MRVVEITTTDGLEALRPEWEALWNHVPTAGPFQHPDWLLPWCRYFTPQQLWTVAVRDGGALVAVAPFFIYADAASGDRQLTLLGNGVSDQLDVLALPDRPGLIRLVLDHVSARRTLWDSCDFRDLPPHSPLLADGLGRREFICSDDTPCPVLDLAGTNGDLSGVASKKLLADLRYQHRRAGALGGLRIEQATDATLDDSLDLLFELHGSRWMSRGGDGVFSEDRVCAFHRDVARRFLRRGWLRLYVARLRTKSVASNYGFHVRRRSYSYIGGFDPSIARLSPGGLAIQHAIADAVQDGAREFDFLRGAEPYKYRWGAHDRRQYRLRLTSNIDRRATRSSLQCSTS